MTNSWDPMDCSPPDSSVHGIFQARIGREFKSFTAITPAAMWKVAETVQALGVGQTGTVVKFKRTDVIGKECGAQIDISEYNGQERSSITKVISLKELNEARS